MVAHSLIAEWHNLKKIQNRRFASPDEVKPLQDKHFHHVAYTNLILTKRDRDDFQSNKTPAAHVLSRQSWVWQKKKQGGIKVLVIRQFSNRHGHIASHMRWPYSPTNDIHNFGFLKVTRLKYDLFIISVALNYNYTRIRQQ